MLRVKRVLYHAPTGSGKTVVLSQIIISSIEKGSKVLVVVRGKSLVHQCHERLASEGVNAGMIQGNNTYNIHLPVLVSSIDTLYSRKLVPDADLCCIDECHLSFGKGYEWFLDQYKDKYIIGLSATPHSKKGMSHIADVVVRTISAKELTQQGYLSPLRYFSPTTIDRNQLVKSSTGDFTEKSMTEVMSNAVIMGDVVDNWIQNGEGRPTFLYCPSIKVSKMFCERFADKGLKIVHIDANTKDTERKRVLSQLAKGELDLVSSVGILITGIDVPPLSCGIIARPTDSYNLWIQMIGRFTRIHPSKKDALIFDHVGNVMEHGFLEDEKECSLDPIPKSSRKKEKLPRLLTCDVCFATFPWATNGNKCPACGHININEASKKLEDEDFILAEVTKDLYWQAELKNLIDTAQKKQYRRGWLFHKMKQKFGDEIAEEAWPKIRAVRGLPKSLPKTPGMRI